jgi:two-component system chemotaxis response regulator CheY
MYLALFIPSNRNIFSYIPLTSICKWSADNKKREQLFPWIMTKASVKLLVVEDSGVMRRIISSFLARMGYADVLEASDANGALKIIATEPVAVVISDYSMPGLNGLDLLKAIRRDPMHKNLPFVMVTAEAQLGQIIAAFREGAQQYVTKPFTAEYLEYIINKVVR